MQCRPEWELGAAWLRLETQAGGQAKGHCSGGSPRRGFSVMEWMSRIPSPDFPGSRLLPLPPPLPLPDTGASPETSLGSGGRSSRESGAGGRGPTVEWLRSLSHPVPAAASVSAVSWSQDQDINEEKASTGHWHSYPNLQRKQREEGKEAAFQSGKQPDGGRTRGNK